MGFTLAMGCQWGRFGCMGTLLLGRPEGTVENSPAFQRWVERQKVASPEGTAEACLRRKTKWRGRQVQSHTASFSRPFGTCVPCGLFPGVKTPGFSRYIPPGQRNVATTFFAEQATRFISDASKGISRLRCPAGKMWATISLLGERAACLSHPLRCGQDVRAGVSTNLIFGVGGGLV